MSDEAGPLLQRARQGDVDAFAALFESMRPLVYAVAFRLVGHNDADDVVMETYLKAWQALPRFRGKSSLKTWMYRVAYNCAVDFLRARRRTPSSVEEKREEHDELLANMPDGGQRTADCLVAQQETVAGVRAAMNMLPDEHRVTLSLRFSDGLSYAEIAAATGVSIGTVMSRLFYGKRKLRALLRKESGA